MPRLLLLILILSLPSVAAPLKILAIGDSLTDEYGGLSLIFSEPDLPSSNDRAYNWPELLVAHRPGEVDFGTFETRIDLRLTGYSRNFGFVGSTTFDWLGILTSDEISDPYFSSYTSLLAELPSADVVVIFLGGNDIKNDYSDIFNNTEPSNFFPQRKNWITAAHSFVRNNNPTVPIVVATMPDVGATPQIYQIYNTEPQITDTRNKIHGWNETLTSTFEAKTNTAVARVDKLTDLIHDSSPFHLNGTEFTIEGDPFNPPDHVFCKDDFHPGTAAQALIANEIIEAINSLFPAQNHITPFTHREILETVLGLDPDQPFLDWVTPFSLAADGPDDDPDGDGVANLVEMLLGTAPNVAATPFTGSWSPGASLAWPLDTDAARYLDWTAEESTDLTLWSEVPPARLVSGTNPASATPAAGNCGFLRLRASPKP